MLSPDDVHMTAAGDSDSAHLGHLFSAFRSEAVFNDDNEFTFSSTEQKRIEDMVSEEFNKHVAGEVETPAPVLHREKHVTYLRSSLAQLTRSYDTLDASRPWLVYWTVHALALLGESFEKETIDRIVTFLKTCEGIGGGYGGGPGQLPHLATTYAAVMALCTVGTEKAYQSINRASLKSYLKLMKLNDGGFRMHDGGEADIRGAYCALAIATITNLIDETLRDKAAEWLISCQTYEGGFGGVQGCEAHGGYTFCGLAALTLLGKEKLAYMPSLLKWLVFKQMPFEGGFQGRTNKLVDGCYSFWQAASFPVVEMLLKKEGEQPNKCLFDNKALQEFIMICCQDKNGGLKDKPDKKRDLYHTCYTLSGLAIAQHSLSARSDIVGGEGNAVLPTHPLYNIVLLAEQEAKAYFSRLDLLS